MQHVVYDAIRGRLLEDWQRGLPTSERPFSVIAEDLGTEEGEVLKALVRLQAEGAITRVGAVVRPNTLGASTLAAIAAAEMDVDRVARDLAAEPGVNHVYLREHDWNLWFVVTGPDRAYVDEVLARVSARSKRRVLDLRLVRPYHIDLGFPLTEAGSQRASRRKTGARSGTYEEIDGDRELLQALTTGLPLVPRPYAEIAFQLGRKEQELRERIEHLVAIGVVPRLGIIVRHRALGWRSNAMVLWDVPEEQVDRCGELLAGAQGINLCYRRTRYETEWPFNLYCMVHARTREEAHAVLRGAEHAAGLGSFPRQMLFSIRCFKQTGAMLVRPREAA